MASYLSWSSGVRACVRACVGVRACVRRQGANSRLSYGPTSEKEKREEIDLERKAFEDRLAEEADKSAMEIELRQRELMRVKDDRRKSSRRSRSARAKRRERPQRR